jgi:hypothetical protein
VLEHGVREPFRARWALHGAGDVGRAVEVLEGLDKGVGRASGTRTSWWARGGWHYEIRE